MSYYGGRSLHEQSHGEAFLALMTNRFSNDGLYVLDEPEAALSPARQMAALARMHELV
ncbi:putative ATPase [Mycobacteroides chelonae]|nr:putative ATPase [Mycobacteroides chelonae]